VVVNKKTVKRSVVNTSIYYRWARSDRMVSVFIMFRDKHQEDGENKVHVLFTRSLDETRCKDSDGGLGTLSVFLENHLHIQREHYFDFIDGPNYTEKHKTMDGCYDYFCTSGGIPAFKNCLWGKVRRWILNGWSKDEAIQALITLHARQDNPTAVRAVEDTASEMDKHLKEILEKANRAYWLCGGRIRDLLKAYDDFEGVKMDIVQSLHHLNAEGIIIAGSETWLSSGLHLDRLRTMLRATSGDIDNLMFSFLVVESPFKLLYAANRVDVAQWVEAYNKVKVGCPQFIGGGFFEMAVHRWIQTNGTYTASKSSPIKKVCWSVGTGTEDVDMMMKRNMYCVPSTCDFSNIDSVLVVDNILHVFQMTAEKQLDFNLYTFVENFALPVWKTSPFNFVFIHVVIPSGTTFPFKDLKAKLAKQSDKVKTELSTQTNKATSFGILDPTSDMEDSFVIDLKPIPHVVDMTSASTLGKYLKILLKDLTTTNHTGQPVRILVEPS
jgi:hypothetical protein